MRASIKSSQLQTNFTHCSGSPKPAKRAAPVSIRFTQGEKQSLEAAAAGEALGPYIKRSVLKQHRVKRKPQGKAQTRQHETLARTLRRLGDSGVYSVLHSLIVAVEEQRLILDQAQEDDLRHASIEVMAIRNDLVTSLGLQAETR